MGNLGSLITGLLTSGGNPTMDLSSLFDTIKNAGQYQRTIVNSLPAEIQANLAKYAASQNAGADKLQGDVDTQGNSFLSQIKSLYGPTSDAANAQNVANKQNIYSTVPGTQNAIRNALAASGGLSRGNAGVALAQPYVNAAQQYGNAAAGVSATQTAAQQQATQQALTIINSMEAGVFQQKFGMTQAQATQILTTGNQALQQQLAQLIAQSNMETNQNLGVQGVGVTNAYNNAVIDQGQKNAMIGDAVNLGLNGASAGFNAMGGASGIFGGLNGASGGAPDLSTVMGSSTYQQPSLNLR